MDDPKKLYTSGISDHGMVQAKARFSAAKAPGEGIIPLPYLKHKMFPIIFDQLAYETRIRFCVDPWEQKKYLVGIIEAAAMYVREWMQDSKEENDVFRRDQLLASMSRVIWSQNTTIANRIIETSSVAAKFLNVSTSDDGLSSLISLIYSSVF